MRATLIAVAAVFLVTYHSSPSSGSTANTAGGVTVVSSAQAPTTKATTSLSLDLPNTQIGQVEIADILTYGGPRPTITAPDGWELIRDDYTPTTRQSLYWRAIGGGDSSTAEWTFSEPVDAQGAIVLLDNVASDAPVDASSGNTGGLAGTITAKSVMTSTDGDLILAFNATDFGGFYRYASCGICGGLGPTMPENESIVLNQEATGLEYWILASSQSQMGQTDPQISFAPQFYNWAAAQIAIKPGR